MSTPAVTIEVADRFDDLRRKYLLTRLGIALAVAVAAALSVWLLLATVDYFQEWSLTWRKVTMSLGVAAVAVWLVSRFIVIARDSRRKVFAGLLERSFDGFGQRIRTVLDTVKGTVSGPEEMLTALGNQTLGRWETLSPGQLVPSRGLLTAGVICLTMLVITGAIFSGGGDMNIAMQRALGSELPYTTMVVQPGNDKVLEGLPMNVSLELKGRVNREVLLKHRSIPLPTTEDASLDSDTAVELEWTETELLPAEPAEGQAVDSRRALFEMNLGKALEPVEYQFLTSVGPTEIYRIDVQPLIELERIETTVQPPAYTRLEERSFTARDINVLENSIVTITLETNHPLSQAVLEAGPKPSKLKPVDAPASNDGTLWTFTLPTTSSVHWRFSGEGHDGTPMTPVKGRLRIRRDGAPKVTWRDPVDEITVHTLAEIPMRVQMADDYGLSESAIVFQLGDDEEFVLKDWFADSDGDVGGNRTSLKLEEILPLESFALTERDFISYYAYAIDNREGSVQRTESDVRYIDVRPLRQYFGEIELEPGDAAASDRLRANLSEIIRRQRYLINRTRRMTRSSSTDLAKQLGTIDRMVENQSELAGLVRILTEFLVMQGNDDVEALNQAEAAMLQAADSLAAAGFDLALIQENDALLALAEARRTLDIFLIKNPTPQQMQQLARFNRQFRQKLRRERPETESEIADTLQRIAAQQRQLGQMAAQMQAAAQNSQNNGSNGQGGKNNQPNDGQPKNTSGDPTETEESESAEEDGKPADEATESEAEDKDVEGADDANDAEAEMDEEGTGEPTLEEQQEDIYARQIDLLERIQAIEEQLAERLADSALMNRRMVSAKAGMDDLSSQARDRDFGQFQAGSLAVADQLQEIGIQLDALQETEAVSRVSSIRDLTSSLSDMENQLSQQMRNGPPSDQSQPGSGTGMRLANRIRERTETIEDVLKMPVDVGDTETSEVNDQLQNFIEETEFLEQLQESRDALEEMANGAAPDADSSEVDEAFERAVEFAEASQLLDDLYQQLVTPRLAQLRELEEEANRLVQQAQAGQGGNARRMDAETQAAFAELREQLESAGMQELAELLDENEVPDEEIDAMLRQNNRNGAVARASSANAWGTTTARMALVVQSLREQIQETILVEISADRDAPVPVEYRELVDGYFRTLAGEADAKKMGSSK